MRSLTVACAAAVLLAGGLALARESKSELKQDLRDNEVVGNWIYDDIDAGFAQAVREKKPLCVVFR
jgi:hypothetical protein